MQNKVLKMCMHVNICNARVSVLVTSRAHRADSSQWVSITSRATVPTRDNVVYLG